MLSVTLAAVLAILFLGMFRSTRPLAAIGLFVLVAISPLLFGGLLLLAALVYFLFFRRADDGALPQNRLPPPDDGARRRRTLGLFVVATGAVGLLALAYTPKTGEGELLSVGQGETRAAPGEEVVVVHTPGGLLEVSRIDAVEDMDAKFTHSLLGVDVGAITPRIRIPSVFRYHVELAQNLRVLRSNGVFLVVAPMVKPTLPVAVDFAGIEKQVSGSWLLLPIAGNRDLDALERTITAKLAQKAASRDYIERQREEARATMREFVRAWLAQQTRWRDARFEDVRVLFADESAGSLAPLAL